ncbi:MAG: GNAT family N-acetyltransferase [Candidatus Omnitrophica bacterium]|nr:GNAT family N-acetyltransferase [Candidatus Omnitrophota bacterium]
MMREHEGRDRHFALAPGNPESNFREYLEEILGKQDAAVYVADEDGAIVGYVLALILENPGIFELRKYGFIGEMSVATNRRRHGIGRLLWDRVKGLVSPQGNRGGPIERFAEEQKWRRFLDVPRF